MTLNFTIIFRLFVSLIPVSFLPMAYSDMFKMKFLVIYSIFQSPLVYNLFLLNHIHIIDYMPNTHVKHYKLKLFYNNNMKPLRGE